MARLGPVHALFVLRAGPDAPTPPCFLRPDVGDAWCDVAGLQSGHNSNGLLLGPDLPT